MKRRFLLASLFLALTSLVALLCTIIEEISNQKIASVVCIISALQILTFFIWVILKEANTKEARQ